MKPAEPQDPMELVGVGIPQADVDGMAECVIDEYVRLGWTERQIMQLFAQPYFRATHAVYRAKGEDHVRALIARVLAKWAPEGAMESPDA